MSTFKVVSFPQSDHNLQVQQIYAQELDQLLAKFPKDFVVGTAIGPADYPFKPTLEQTSQPVDEAITLFVQNPDDPLCKANSTFKQLKVVYLPNPGSFSDYGRKVVIPDSDFEFVDQGNNIGKETTQ